MKKWLIGFGIVLLLVAGGTVGVLYWLTKHSSLPREAVIATIKSDVNLDMSMTGGRLGLDGVFRATDVTIALPSGESFIKAERLRIRF